MKKGILFLLILCSVQFAFSQLAPSRNYTIKGQVIDSIDNKGVPFSTVTVYKLPEKTVEKRFATDVDGNFSVILPKSGNYSISMQSVSYEVLSKSIELKDESVVNLGKLMLKGSTKEIDAVQVTLMKPLVKVNIDKITFNSESDPDSRTSTVLDMLRKVPLVTVDGEDNIKLKGGTNFKIFMNGKPSTMLNNNAKDVLKGMPASSVKDIEIITSPGAKYDAEGIGGIINIITEKKSIEGYTGTARASCNTDGSGSTGLYLALTHGKFSFSTNLNIYYTHPKEQRNTISRENYSSINSHYADWKGTSRNEGLFPWGEGQASYEIDSLNLISLSFDAWGGKRKSNSHSLIDIRNKDFVSTQTYESNSTNNSFYGGPEGNLDFQHIFKQNKQQIFTLSYKVNYIPTTSKGTSDMLGVLNFQDLHQKSENKAHSAEHTFQADYVHPLTKDQKIESGLKGIIRLNGSNTDYYMFANNQFVINPLRKSDFDYTQNIYAAYLSYCLNINKVGLKAGVRAEKSFIDGTITSTEKTTLSNNSLEFVPSVTLSYQLKPTQNLKASYSMSIQRPDIWYLNPYVNDLDPKNISFGNPTLDPEKNHNIDLTFSNFGATNLNISTYYSFCQNSIENITTVKQDTSIMTYGNVGKKWSVGMSMYGSQQFGKSLNISTNGSINYENTKNTVDESIKNSGWGGNISMNARYVIGKGYSVSANGGYYFPRVQLQSKSDAFYYTSFRINKELCDKKLNISLSANRVFWKEMVYSSQSFGPNFYQSNHNYSPGRSFSISVSYRFGGMGAEVKKVQRGINNDDVKSGGKGNGGGGGQ